MNKLFENATYFFGIILLVAGCMKIIDPLLWHKIEANFLIGVSLLLDVAVGCLLIANRGSKRIFQIAMVVFLAYAVFLIVSIVNGKWTCDCLGGARTLLLPLVVDGTAVIYFGLRLRESREGTLDFQVLASLLVALTAIAMLTRPKNPPIQFVDSEVVESGSVWKRSMFVLANNTEVPIKMTGLNGSCSFIPLTIFPVEIERNGHATVEVLVRNPGERTMSYVDGRTELYYEFSGNTLSQDLRWGIDL